MALKDPFSLRTGQDRSFGRLSVRGRRWRRQGGGFRRRMTIEPLERRTLLSTTGSDQPGDLVTDVDSPVGLAQIQGTKWNDLDGDGLRDGDEPALEGATIYLDLNDNGVRETGGGVEPDDFPQGAVLNDAVPGVTLAVANSQNEPSTFFKVQAGTDTYSSTGEKVFLESGIPFWTSGFRFRADFDEPMASVSLDFISSSNFGQAGILYAFDAGGNLLETYQTASLSAGHVETMTIVRTEAEISYVVSYTITGAFGRLDNLVFGDDPEPFTVTDQNGQYAFVDLLPGDYVVREEVPAGFEQTFPSISPARLFATNTVPSPDKIVELDPADGSVLNQFSAPAPYLSQNTGLAFDGQTLYFVTSFGTRTLFELDPDDGAVRDSTVLPSGWYEGLAALDGLVYILNSYDDILVFDPATNTVVNTLDINAVNPGLSLYGGLGAITGPSQLIAATSSNEVVFLDPETGQLEGSFSHAGGLDRGVAAADQEIFLGFSTNEVRVFDRGGAPQRSFSPGFSIFALAGSSSTDDAHRVSLEPDEIADGLDFGNQSKRAEIGGAKWSDLDGDGVRDDAEPPMEGVTVYLDLNDNGVQETGGTAEPDDFAHGDVLNEAFPGVTLAVANSQNVPSTFFEVRAGTDTHSSTGDKVFTQHGIPFWTSGFRFRADFDEPVANVSLDFIASGGLMQRGILYAFDASGTLLETVETALLSAGQVETMTVARAEDDVAYVVAYTIEGAFGRLDNLVFGDDPEPFAVTDADGEYAFVGLPPGDYVVREIVPEGYQQTSPTASPARLFATSTPASRIRELDPTDGTVLNEFPPPVSLFGSNHGLALADGVLYFVSTADKRVYELDPDDGSVLDSTALPWGPYDGVAAVDGLVYVLNWSKDDGVIVDPETNTVIGTLDLNGVNPGLNFGGGFGEITDPSELIATTTTNQVVFLDPSTGSVTSSFNHTLGGSFDSGATSLDGEIYLGFGDGTIQVYDRGGNLQRSFSAGVGLYALGGADAKDDAHRVTVGPGEIRSGLDFGNQFALGQIGGIKWHDANRDGVRDPDELPMEGVTIYLDLNDDGLRQTGGGVEPDDFAEGAVLNDAVDGVTLAVADGSNVPITLFEVRAGSDTFSSTGDKVFTENGIPFWTTGFRFRADFDEPVAKASLDFISSGSAQRGILLAFGAADDLLDTYDTASLSAGQAETMTVARAEGDIAYVVAYTTQGSFGRLDNLVFGADPEPFAVTDETGAYQFVDLLPGKYVVREEVPEGFLCTFPEAGPGTYYGSAYAGGTGKTQLVEIDAGTGEVTWIGQPMSVRMHGLVMTNDGQLYGVNGWDDSLYSVDGQTGQVTLIGPADPEGYEIVFGLAYDAATDTIYGLGRPTDEDPIMKLLVFNRETGRATPIGPGISGLKYTSGLAFDAANSRVIAFDNDDDEFYAFHPDGTADLLSTASPAINGWAMAHNGDGVVMHLWNSGNINVQLAIVNPDTGERIGLLEPSGLTNLEALDYVPGEPFVHRITLTAGQTVAGLDFGNAPANLPPTAEAGGPYSVAEGGTVPLDASASSDPEGLPLAYLWDLDGDGQFGETGPEAHRGDEVGVSPSFSAAGLDGPSSLVVALRVIDDGDLTDEDTATIDVTNVEPVITVLASDATFTTQAAENEAVTVDGSFTDAGTLDTHTAVVDWGDGTLPEPAAVDQGSGAGTVTATHAYAHGGVYTVTLTLTDDDTGLDVEITTAVVIGAGVNNRVLQIVGTSSGDQVMINELGSGTFKVHADFFPEASFRSFGIAEIDVIHAWLCDGDDHMSIAGNIDAPSILDGGPGNDHLTAGGGPGVLLGGLGDDELRSGGGRDIVIGGWGADRLVAGPEGDLLIGGTTQFDENDAALLAFLEEWNSDRTYDQRVANIRNGAGPVLDETGFKLEKGVTVFDDGQCDQLTGASGQDWFFFDPLEDELTDGHTDEQAN